MSDILNLIQPQSTESEALERVKQSPLALRDTETNKLEDTNATPNDNSSHRD